MTMSTAQQEALELILTRATVDREFRNALLFNPRCAEEMATSIHRLWTDAALRARLVERGTLEVRKYSWHRTARLFRAHYRRISGRQLANEDRALIVSLDSAIADSMFHHGGTIKTGIRSTDNGIAIKKKPCFPFQYKEEFILQVFMRWVSRIMRCYDTHF